MEIRKLSKYTIEDQRLLGGFGYTSAYKYMIKRENVDENTIINIELIPLETDYSKDYPEGIDDFERYERIIPCGYSLGVFSNNELIATTICEPYAWNKTLFIWNFQVSVSRQRTGVGEYLMKSLEGLAKDSGFRAIGLETQNTNVPAIKFYKKCGFELEGIDMSHYTNHYVESGEVALFMRKKLIY